MPGLAPQSQFETLEPPTDAIEVDVTCEPRACVDEIVSKMKNSPSAPRMPSRRGSAPPASARHALDGVHAAAERHDLHR